MSASQKAAVCRFCGQVYYGPGALQEARDCEDFDRAEQED